MVRGMNDVVSVEHNLTPAELASLAALANYEYARDAAASRGVSTQTFKNELTRAFKKLGVSTRTGAWIKIGWLNPPEDFSQRLDSRS